MTERDYASYTDEEIVDFSHGGEDAATDFLLEKYKALVRKKARTLYLIGGENDDLIQEGMIALYKAIRSYSSPADGTFISFASQCIENQLCNVIKGANRLKNSPLNSYVSLYSSMSDDAEERLSHEILADTLQPANLINPEDILIDRENVTTIESKLEHGLSAFAKSVVNLYIDGCNYQQIAKRLGRTPKSVDNALQRIKKKLSR